MLFEEVLRYFEEMLNIEYNLEYFNPRLRKNNNKFKIAKQSFAF